MYWPSLKVFIIYCLEKTLYPQSKARFENSQKKQASIFFCDKAFLITRPRSVLVGIFWRFGLFENLPVDEPCWIKSAWSLPSILPSSAKHRYTSKRSFWSSRKFNYFSIILFSSTSFLKVEISVEYPPLADFLIPLLEGPFFQTKQRDSCFGDL